MRLGLPVESNPTAVMMVHIDGFWSVKEFRELLATTEDVYNRVAVTTLFGDFVREEERENEILRNAERSRETNWSWSNLYYGAQEFRYQGGDFAEMGRRAQPWETALAAVQPFVASLSVGAIRLESPGWVNLIGHLNPLKTIADFISKWRTENTKRAKIEIDANLERDRLALDREKMNRQFALDILGHMPEGQYSQAIRFAEIAEHTINPSIAALNRLALDGRIIDTELVGTPSAKPSLPGDKPQARRARKDRLI